MLRMEDFRMRRAGAPVGGRLPSSNFWGAKKRLIATHPSSEILPTRSQQTTSQSLIATLNEFLVSPPSSAPHQRCPSPQFLIPLPGLESSVTHCKQTTAPSSNPLKTGGSPPPRSQPFFPSPPAPSPQSPPNACVTIPLHMPKLRISIVEFLNTAPLVWGFIEGPLAGKYDLSFTVPSQCAEALRRGDADVAIIPSIEYQRIENVVALPGMAIAAKREVRSLLVVAKKPIEKAKRIALDTSSRSTAALVRMLAAEEWGIQPEYVEAAPNPSEMLK